MLRASVWAPALPCTLRESVPGLYQRINVVQMARRQVERNTVRYTGIELGNGVQVSGATVYFNATIELGELDSGTTLYDICLIDDFQGFAVNTEVQGRILLSGGLNLPSERVSVSLLSSQKENAFNVTARSLAICTENRACYSVPDLRELGADQWTPPATTTQPATQKTQNAQNSQK